MIVKRKDGFHVVSHKGKNLGGPYDSREEALKRLHEVEHFKHSKKEDSRDDLATIEVDEDGDVNDEYIDEDVEDKDEEIILKEHYCFVRGIELKESSDGEFYVDGLIATSHIDSVGDRIPSSTLNVWAKEINSGNPQVNKVSYHHDRQPKVVGKGMPPASVIKLPDGEFGLRAITHVNKSWDGFDNLVYEVKNGFVDGFSIEFTTKGNETVTFEKVGNKEIRVFNPNTELHGWAFASRPVQKEAVIATYGFKEAVLETPTEKKEPIDKNIADNISAKEDKMADEKEAPTISTVELKEKFDTAINQISERIAKMEVKERVLKTETKEVVELPLEVKEFKDMLGRNDLSFKEQSFRASRVAEKYGLWEKGTSKAESREFKHFGTNGRLLEYKSLGLTTNQNTDTDYLQSTAELQDVYDPVIFNMLNQVTVTWNVLAKDNFSMKGNNQVQFVGKTAANTTASAYTGNAVTTGNVTRLKYQSKFKKYQVGVSVDGDMIAAARGGPVADVFAQEVADSTMDLLAVMNVALYAEVGLETAAGVIGFEYITDSAGNTSLYNLTRSAANKLAPDSAADTYINGSSAVITMTNLRAAIKQAVVEGANKRNLVFFTNPTQGNLLRGKFDDARRMLIATNTDFGFSTDLIVDGIPVFEDKDCNTDDWFLVDLDTHRIGIWVPPTIEKLGKTADSEDAFIKTYWCTYNKAPRRMVQIYGNATS